MSVKSFFTAFFLVIAIVAAAGFMGFRRFAFEPISSQPGEMIVDVAPGANFFSIRKQLSEQKIQIDPFALRVWIHLHDAKPKLRIGEYRIQNNWSRLRLLNEILSGSPVLHKLIVKEGHNIWDVEEEFQRVWPAGGVKEYRALLKDDTLLNRMSVPASLPVGAHRTLEGFLFPETYSYQKYDSPRQVVDAMLDQFEKRSLPLLKSHPWGATAEGRYRLLTLASIVEKESGNPQEQPLVASVFWNRLKKHMRLQSDPTTMYALFPNFDGTIHKINLITPSAYNTYTLPELPAGPICNPSENAINAVLNPAETKYLYFVSRNDGAHVFSVDYKTHAANVNHYQLGGPKPAQR